ncbi:MAG: hypothetical protein JW874_07510 [Spirochaetales bacterium]|nr:hypothetical protein [Spirochaetales bacterium]
MVYVYFTGMIEQQWRKIFDQGRNSLVQKDIKAALHLFSMALKSCPSTRPKDLERIIFYTGITLQKLGMNAYALKTWKSALSFDKNGFSARMFRRFSNDYGMPRQPNSEEDDKNAFIAVQRQKYLSGKNSGRFCTEAEEDMVNELILEKWQSITGSVSLSDMTPDAKLQFFYGVNVCFPFIQVPDYFGAMR